MAQRPTDPREWAEQADAKDISEPATERPRGYNFSEDLPNDQFNYLLQQLFRWVDYFDELFQRSAGLVDFFSGIDFGDYGDVKLQTDDSGQWTLEWIHTNGGSTTLISTNLSADNDVITPRLTSNGSFLINVRGSTLIDPGGFILAVLQQATTDPISIEDDAGNGGEGGFLLDYLTQGTSSPVSIFDGSGNLGDLELGGLFGPSNDEIDATTSYVLGQGDIRAWAELSIDVADDSVSILSSTKMSNARTGNNTGEYEVTIDEYDTIGDAPTNSDMAAFGTLNDYSAITTAPSTSAAIVGVVVEFDGIDQSSDLGVRIRLVRADGTLADPADYSSMTLTVSVAVTYKP